MKLILFKKHYLLTVKILIFCVVAFVGTLTVMAYMPLKTPMKMFVVLSGSMNPTVPVGSVVLVTRQTEPIQKGDVITFIHPDKPMDFVTHRVINIKEEGSAISYQTQGDANNTPDLWLVKKEAVWGKVNFAIPYLGYLVNFSKTKLGLVVMVILPLLFIAGSEIAVIIKEVKRLRHIYE